MSAVQLSLNIAPPAPPRSAAVPLPPYTVALRDSDLDHHDRIKAETRFCKVLEERLGTPEQIRDMVRLLQSAEADGRPLTPQEEALAKQWQRAHLSARLAGLQDLAAISDAWFELEA